MASANGPFKPALIVVDMQEDFCPPNGSLAVQDGRSIAPIINTLLSLPGFVLKVGTQDFHPESHISFAPNHPPPHNVPFTTFVEMKNPLSSSEETKPQRLWPVHCVAESYGANIIPEIHVHDMDLVVKKGMDERVEMYSAFADAFGNKCLETKGASMDLAMALREKDVTDVFVVGLAGDYCVKSTAIDAAREGFKTYVIEEGVKSVDPGEGWEGTKEELGKIGVKLASIEGEEVRRVKVAGEKH